MSSNSVRFCRFLNLFSRQACWRFSVWSPGDSEVRKVAPPVVQTAARWPMVLFCYQSEIKALTVANFKGLLLACPVPRGSFWPSKLMWFGSQRGLPLIMKGRIDAPQTHQAWFQWIFTPSKTVQQWATEMIFFSFFFFLLLRISIKSEASSV